MPYESFNALDSITYDLSLVEYDDDTETLITLKCVLASNCKITYSRAYTPILYYISPPVVYNGSQVAFWVDPRYA